MSESEELSTPQKTISEYVAACRNGDVEKLRSVFAGHGT
jgi:hypothetical protein